MFTELPCEALHQKVKKKKKKENKLASQDATGS